MKQLLVDAIIGGREPSSYEKMGAFEKKGLGRFRSNGWNDWWEWNREKLQTLGKIRLTEIYEDLNK